MNGLGTRHVPVNTQHRGPGTEWGRRHGKSVALVRSLVAIWLVVLGSLFCASGDWWGACLFPLAALVGAVGWFAYKRRIRRKSALSG